MRLDYHVCPTCKRLFMWTRANKCRYCGSIYQQLRNNPFNVTREEIMATLHSSGTNCHFCEMDIKGYKANAVDGFPACPYCYATYNYLRELPLEAVKKLVPTDEEFNALFNDN